MAVFHDEVEIEDFQYDEDSETYFYPCPCGDNFCITKEDLENGEDVATCPSCSLIIKVIYDKGQSFCGLLFMRVWILSIGCQVHLQLKKQVHHMTCLDFVLKTLNWKCFHPNIKEDNFKSMLFSLSFIFISLHYYFII
ncbi:DPH3 homolog isoform X1 [Bubalus bubalis]|uniref:DPH3 homolog isoform X1 n=1 Tax=Bubalus bubalis TaxID=89462 RepID=UPI00042CDE1E|nr:DPH3 homolog isoform X1 [Bubalus bubalis]